MSEETAVTPEAVATPSETPAPTPSPTPAPAGNNAGDWERKEKGFLADIQRERQARQRYQAGYEKTQAELETERRRVQVALGVNPPSQKQAEDEAIRQAFAEKFPHLAELTAEDIQTLRELKDQKGRLQEATDNHWFRHNKQTLNTINESVADELGGGTLTPKQARMVKNEYIAFLEDGGQPFVDRHEAGDKTLIDEFVAQLMTEWREPIRKSVTSQETNRNRPVPSGKGRTISAIGGKKKFDASDPKAFGDALVESYREHGGTFDR